MLHQTTGYRCQAIQQCQCQSGQPVNMSRLTRANHVPPNLGYSCSHNWTISTKFTTD